MPTRSSASTRTDPFALTWRRIGVVGLLGGVLLLLVLSDTLHARLVDVVAWGSAVVSTHPVLGAVAFLLLSAASAMLAFFSTSVLVPVALATWGGTVTFILLWVGWILGGVLAYTLSRFIGRPVASVVLSEDVLAYGDQLSVRTPFSYVLLFQLAVPSEIPGYVLGLMCYRFGAYLAAVALAELPYAVVTVLLGDSILQQRVLLLVVLGIAVIAFSGVTLHRLRRHLRTPGESSKTGGAR